MEIPASYGSAAPADRHRRTSTPHSASSVPRSTPKSCSIRANSASFFFSASRAVDDAPVRDAAVDVLPDLLVELRLLLHLPEHATCRARCGPSRGSRSLPKCLLPARGRENCRATGRSRAALRRTPRAAWPAGRRPARPARSRVRRVRDFGESGCFMGASLAARAGGRQRP